jgi:hypothetical protein
MSRLVRKKMVGFFWSFDITEKTAILQQPFVFGPRSERSYQVEAIPRQRNDTGRRIENSRSVGLMG